MKFRTVPKFNFGNRPCRGYPIEFELQNINFIGAGQWDMDILALMSVKSS